jgi:4,5:9,10-diseco-3-hydroxy-5,9,17-trioxoandrosta-1(10),2-diene-4-oate hydrolase
MELPTYEDRYVDVDGSRVRYWVEGEGPAVLLVHGLACSAEFWQYNVAPLAAEAEYRVHALDLPGFGLSDKQLQNFSLEYAASFLRRFMDALGIERAILAGNSMGGVLCAQLAMESPQRLDGLILVGSAGFGKELNPFLRLWSLTLVGDLLFRGYQMAFPALKVWVFCDASSIQEDWLEGAAAMLRMPGVRENTLRVARTGLNLRGQREELFRGLHSGLGSVSVPTLIVWGDHDAAVPVSHAYAAQELIPHAELRIMEGCGHTPQVERPEEFNELVLEFLDSVSATER